MNILSFISYGNTIALVLLAVYSIKFSPFQSRLNRYSLFVCLSLGLWNFCYIFFYTAADEATAWFWHRIATLGMYFFPAATLFYFLTLTKNTAIFRRTYHYLLIYLPSIAFICYHILSQKSSLAQKLVRSSSGFGWTYINSRPSITYWLSLVYLISYFFVIFLCLFRWRYTSTYHSERKQATIFLVIDLSVLISGTVTDFILPLRSQLLPPMANLFTGIFIVSYWYIIRRYNVFNVSHIASSERILKTITDLIIVVDKNNHILRTNHAAYEVLGYHEAFLKDKPLQELFAVQAFSEEKDNLGIFFDPGESQGEISLLTSQGVAIPMLYTKSIVEGRANEFLGTVIVLKDITVMKQMEDKLKSVNEKYKKATDDLYQIANFDSLTGIPNRRQFFNEMNSRITNYHESGKDFALIFMDLNGFKAVNDRYGHDIGDLLLIESIGLLQPCLKEKDMLARIGGDEFVMLLSLSQGTFEVNERIRTIKHKFIHPILIGNHNCKISVAAGACICSESAHTIDDMIQRADIAMYQDKEKQTSRIE